MTDRRTANVCSFVPRFFLWIELQPFAVLWTLLRTSIYGRCSEVCMYVNYQCVCIYYLPNYLCMYDTFYICLYNYYLPNLEIKSIPVNLFISVILSFPLASITAPVNEYSKLSSHHGKIEKQQAGAELCQAQFRLVSLLAQTGGVAGG